MRPHAQESPARRARQAVRHARGLVVMPSPAHVDEMLPSLEQAVAELSTVAEAVRTGEPLDRPATIAVLEECGAELDRVRALLDHAAAWHMAWARILGGMAGTYGPGGTAPALGDCPPRVSVRV